MGVLPYVTLLAPVTAAYAFVRFQFPFRNALFLAVLATQMIPGLTDIIPL